MKLKFFYILSLFCMLFVACSDDEVDLVTQAEFVDIPCEGGTYEINIKIGAEWTATSLTDWCTVAEKSGYGESVVHVSVEGNLREARVGNVVIYSEGQKQTVTFRQQGLDSEELTYKLPVIFHVIYNDPNNKSQNPPAEDIYQILDDVNKFYRNANGGNSQDLNLEFVPAQFDPNGNELEEPGIDRVKWVSATLDATDVMNDQTNKYTHFLWEPNDYINILLYNFSSSTSNILGISTFPYTTKSHPLDGTEVLADMNITLENLKYVRGVSINSSYMYNSDDYLVSLGRVPEEWVELMNLQNKTYITIAHELGHYLGLRHTFSENYGTFDDTDFCSDTKSYDKYGETGYDAQVTTYMQLIAGSEEYASQFDWEKLFNRTDVNGDIFESHNIMDYAYSYLDEFTPQQKERVRHVLLYSPMIPGPKDTRDVLSRGGSISGPMDLPFTTSDGYPRRLFQ